MDNNENFNSSNFNDYNYSNDDEKKEKRRTLFVAFIIFFLLAVTAVLTFPYLKKAFTKEEPKQPETQVVANNDKEDAFAEEIKRLMLDLFDKKKDNVIRQILKELGYSDGYIDKIINDYQKIIDAIFAKVNDGTYTEQEVLRIIKKIIDENINNIEKINDLIRKLFDKGEKDTIRKILKEIGYPDEEIDKIIDDFDKIIEAIKDKIDDGTYTEAEIIGIIEKIIEENKEPEPKKEEPQKEEPKKEEPKKEEPKKEEPQKEEPKQDEPKKEEPSNTEPDKPECDCGSSTEIETDKINVIFENINMLDGSSSSEQPLLIDNKVISFNIILNAPGDYYAFTVDIKNNSNIDVKVDNVISNVLTTEQSKYLGYSLTYDDGTKINKGDVIKAGEKRKIKFVSLYKYVDVLNDHDVTAPYSGRITFVQK